MRLLAEDDAAVLVDAATVIRCMLWPRLDCLSFRDGNDGGGERQDRQQGQGAGQAGETPTAGWVHLVQVSHCLLQRGPCARVAVYAVKLAAAVTLCGDESRHP